MLPDKVVLVVCLLVLSCLSVFTVPARKRFLKYIPNGLSLDNLLEPLPTTDRHMSDHDEIISGSGPSGGEKQASDEPRLASGG